MYLKFNALIFRIFIILNAEAEFKEFEPGFKFKPPAQIWLVPLKIVLNFSRFKPALN